MNKIRKAAATAITVAAVLFCGCDNGSSDAVSAVSSSIAHSSSAEQAFTVPNTNSFSSNDQSNDITYFGSRDISEISELYSKNNGGTITVETSGADYINKLSKKVSADASPDLCDKVDSTYPYQISMNLYEDLTDYIDTTSPQWADMTDVIEHYSFKGGRYFYPTMIKIMPQFLIYIKSTYIQCGNIPDPEMLWRNDNWTWQSFGEGASGIISSEASSADTLISGSGVFVDFLASSGVPLFSQNGSRFVNGLASENAVRVYELLSPYKIDHSSVISAEKEIQGSVFVSGDEKTLAKLRSTNLTVGVVPYPRDKNADKYYCKATAEGFLVPKGAKNIQGAASFINCSRIVDASVEHREKENKKLIQSGLLRSDVEWLESLRGSGKMTPLFVDENCFDSSVNADIRNLLIYDGDSWDEALSEYSVKIDGALESINAVIE